MDPKKELSTPETNYSATISKVKDVGGKAWDWAKKNPGTASLLGVGVPAAAAGIYSLTKGRGKKEDEKTANYRATGNIKKLAEAVVAYNVKTAVTQYLQKFAAAAPQEKRAAAKETVGLIEVNLSQGCSVKEAVQRAIPHMPKAHEFCVKLATEAWLDFLKSANCSAKVTTPKSYSVKMSDKNIFSKVDEE